MIRDLWAINHDQARSIAIKIIFIVTYWFLSACTTLTHNDVTSIIDHQPQRLSVACQRALDQSHELIREHKVAEAEEDLTLSARLQCNSDYESDQYLRLLAYAFSHQKKYTQAIKVYRQIIASEHLDLVTRSDAVYTLAQIHYLQGDYQHVVSQVIDASAKQMLIDDDLQILLARSYHHRAEADKALAIIDPIIQQAVSKQQIVKETWLVFSWNLYLDAQLFEQAFLVGDQLMAYYPNDQHRLRVRRICQREDLLSLCNGMAN